MLTMALLKKMLGYISNRDWTFLQKAK